MVDGRPAVEILYYIANEVHRLKVGLHFQDKLIHDVVNMLHGKEIISTTWLNFANIGKIFIQYVRKLCFKNSVLFVRLLWRHLNDTVFISHLIAISNPV